MSRIAWCMPTNTSHSCDSTGRAVTTSVCASVAFFISLVLIRCHRPRFHSVCCPCTARHVFQTSRKHSRSERSLGREWNCSLQVYHIAEQLSNKAMIWLNKNGTILNFSRNTLNWKIVGKEKKTSVQIGNSVDSKASSDKTDNREIDCKSEFG